MKITCSLNKGVLRAPVRSNVAKTGITFSTPIAPLRKLSVANKARMAVLTEAQMKALIFDCDGVIVETEELHRVAYNAAFRQFNVQIDSKTVVWTEEFYDMLQNKVGGGKPKMNWYFGQHLNQWPTSILHPNAAPTDPAERSRLIDELQDYKTEQYMHMMKSGAFPARPGVLRMMDEARAAGLFVAVCSAATKPACIATLDALLGPERFKALDLFMAGDDVDKKKPDPTIYRVAAERLGVTPDECVVIEDSLVGLKAALGAGMRCCITYTPNTKGAEFPGAERIIAELGDNPPMITVKELMDARIVQDDRISIISTDDSVAFLKNF